MQKSLEIPDLRLPVGLGAPARSRELRRRLADGKVEVTVPPRAWSFGRRKAWALATPVRLGLVVESGAVPPSVPRALAGGAPGPALPHGPAPPGGAPDARVAVRGSLLADLLAQAVAPEVDVRIEVDRLPGIWTRRARLLGETFDNRVDLAALAGTLDVTRCELGLREGRMTVRAGLSGACRGLLEGRLYGVAFAVPIAVRPAMEAELPVALAARRGEVAFGVEGGAAFRIPYEVEATVLRTRLRFRRELPLDAGDLVTSLSLPSVVAAHVPLPTRVVRGRVLATRRLPVRLEWKVEMPRDLSGMLVLTSELRPLHPGGGGP
jgi:hypothetical protein